jgi:hypothetical protein
MRGIVDPQRVRNVLASPKPLFRDRDEEEVRGYREALCLIHENATGLFISEETIRRLHRLTRGRIWNAGCYQSKDGDIQAPRGSKTEMILVALKRLSPEFTVAQLLWIVITPVQKS